MTRKGPSAADEGPAVEIDPAFLRRLDDLLGPYSVRALSVEIGLGKSTVYRWKNGQREPGVFGLKKLAQRLGTTVSALIGEGSEPAPPDRSPRIRAVMDALASLPDDESARILALNEWLLALMGATLAREESHNAQPTAAVQSQAIPNVPTARLTKNARRIESDPAFEAMLNAPDFVASGYRGLKGKRRK
jgi:transcriptional regulator with XRE-family HTH domain